MFEVLLRSKIPTRVVSYEAMILYPTSFKRELLIWLGLDVDTPWPDEPRDENAKYDFH